MVEGHAMETEGRCTVPCPKTDPLGDKRWDSMHERYVTEAKSSEAEVLFIGDSIVQQMQFTSLWTEKINSLHCLNFGIGGDRVEHILWRMINGELEFSIKPKLVVLFVGTNNTDCSGPEIFHGIMEVVKVIRLKLGDVPIVLPTLLPRGQHPNPNRVRNDDVNRLLLENCSKEHNLNVVPIHENVIQKDGTISHHLMYDYLHLTDQGYTKIFSPVYEKLQQLLSC